MRNCHLIVILLLSFAQPSGALSQGLGTEGGSVISSQTRLMALVRGEVYQACCKTCRKGKACGDSCISKSKSCSKGPGCACDG